VRDRPATGALCVALSDVESLVFEVFDQSQISETIIGLVSIDVMQVHAVRDGAVSSAPDDTMLKVADAGFDVHAHVASFGDGSFAAAPVPMILSSTWVSAIAAELPPVRRPVRRVELRAGGAARLTGLGFDGSHTESIGD
jgi:hypothetical protein